MLAAENLCTNKKFDITNTGVYEVLVTGSYYLSPLSNATIKIYAGGVEKKSVYVANILTNQGNPFSINWIGSVTGGTVIKVTLQSSHDVTFDTGCIFTVKKLE